MNKLLEAFLDTLYLHKCIVCDSIIYSEGLCENCKDKLPIISEETCFHCGIDLKHCECDRYFYHFDGIVAPFFNEGFVKDAIYELKFMHNFKCINYVSSLMADYTVQTFGRENIDLICFVPASNKSYRRRGFNQSELFAERIAEKLRIPLSRDKLVKSDKVLTQHILGINDRFTNVRKAYSVNGKVTGKNILLVDDIKTTGATLDECARQLKFAGANAVYCVTALISRKENEDTDIT